MCVISSYKLCIFNCTSVKRLTSITRMNMHMHKHKSAFTKSLTFIFEKTECYCLSIVYKSVILLVCLFCLINRLNTSIFISILLLTIFCECTNFELKCCYSKKVQNLCFLIYYLICYLTWKQNDTQNIQYNGYNADLNWHNFVMNLHKHK